MKKRRRRGYHTQKKVVINITKGVQLIKRFPSRMSGIESKLLNRDLHL